jgi:hypothetical protein
MNAFGHKIKIWHLLLVLMLVQVMMHAAYLKLPAVGNHVWRQCNTLAVARNYYQEDMNILYPRIDKRYHTNGITGPQFTSYDYTLALVYKAFGFSQNAHRYLSLIIGVFAIWGMFFLGLHYFRDKQLAFFCAYAIIGIPEFYYHSINAVPDLLALTSMIWGWYGYQNFLKSGKLLWAILTVILLTLAGMTKIMFLIPGFVFLGDIIQQKIYRKLTIVPILTMGLIVASASFGWYYWANILTSMNGIYEFVHEVRFIEGWGNRFQTLFDNVFKDIPETWVGYGFLSMFITGLYFVAKKRMRDLRVVFVFLGIMLFYSVMQYQLKVHGYYTLLFAPFVLLIGLWGWSQMQNGLTKQLMIVLLVLSPVWAWARMNRNWQKQNFRVANELIVPENQEKIKYLSGQRKYWLVGPDQSGCVDFYYLQAKGFPWYKLEEKSDLFDKFIKDGAEGLITNDTFHAQEYFRELTLNPTCIGNVGKYYWYVF